MDKVISKKSSIFNKYGKFIISLDFELIWGVLESKNKNNYGNNILGVQQVIPRLLKIFNEYDIKATFSIVGFIFHKSKKELLSNLPSVIPYYTNQCISPYGNYILNLEDDLNDDFYHFAPELITEIQKYPNQEIGTHTYSHYYCLEEGQNIETFKADIEKAIQIANNKNIQIKSLVFPRNQINDYYLKICSDLGIICYRGNEKSWIYKATKKSKQNLLRKALRIIDSYINISGHNCYSYKEINKSFPINIPSSRFLRPYSKKLNLIERIRLHRIKSDMTYAAKNNLTYHLWWHPHNFGINQNENFIFLEKILTHYKTLKKEYHFQSYNMSELANKIIDNE